MTTPAHVINTRAIYAAGMAAGRAGRPVPDGETPLFKQAWTHGDVERRIIAGEVVAVSGGATRCSRCKSVVFGMRFACACWPTNEKHLNPFTVKGLEALKAAGYSLEYGAFKLVISDGQRTLDFTTREELRAAMSAGKAIVNDMSGDPVCIS